MVRSLFTLQGAGGPARLWAGLLLLAAPLLSQASRPAGATPSAPPAARPYQKLLAELKALPPAPAGRDARVKVLRKWFVPREKDRHQALQKLLLQGKDRESLAVLLGFLKDDLPVLLAEGRAGTPEGKIFLGYLDPLIALAGGSDRELAGKAVRVLLSLPYKARRERFQVLLARKDGPLFRQALKAVGSMRDLGLAPLAARWLSDKEVAPLAWEALRRLTFRDFHGEEDFRNWWKEARDKSWAQIRDLYLEECLDRERRFLKEKEDYARKARAQVEKELLPYVEELVATRVRARTWKEPLALLERPRTRKAALAGIVRALEADPSLMALPQGEEGKAFRKTFDLLLKWARKGEPGLEDLLLTAIAHLADLPPAEKDLRRRALACLREKALAGPVERRLAALPLLASFSGKEADQILLDLLSRDSKEPPVLYKVISLLKERELTEDKKGLPPALGRAQERLEGLLSNGDLPRRVRTDAILFFARWPYSISLPFLEKVLLGEKGLGRKVEDRLAAADALLDILQRFRKDSNVAKKVGAVLRKGLKVRDPKNPELSRVRTACAEKLGSDFFLELSNRSEMVKDLKEALQAETSPEAVETTVTTLLKLGLKAAKVSDKDTLKAVREALLSRIEVSPSSPKERDWLFNALLELSDGGFQAKVDAGRAFGKVGDRAHALPFFAEVTAKFPLPPGALEGKPADSGKAQARVLLDAFSLLVTGKLFQKAGRDAVLLGNLSLAELEQAGSLLDALGKARAKGDLPAWGPREMAWAAEILWRLATAKRAAREAAAPFFRRAAGAIQALLAQGKVAAKEATLLSLRMAEALLEGGDVKKALIQLWSLVKNPDLEKKARPLLAKALEKTKNWSQAGAQWDQVARYFPKGSREWWLASLKRVECLAREGKVDQARKALVVLQAEGKLGKGPEWVEVNRRFHLVKALLAPKKKSSPRLAPQGKGGGAPSSGGPGKASGGKEKKKG